jgi:hypothetical protein
MPRAAPKLHRKETNKIAKLRTLEPAINQNYFCRPRGRKKRIAFGAGNESLNLKGFLPFQFALNLKGCCPLFMAMDRLHFLPNSMQN